MRAYVSSRYTVTLCRVVIPYNLLTETENRWQVSELGVANALRNGEAGNGDTGDEIRFQEPKIITRPPFHYREKVLQTQNNLPPRRLVLELPERVVGEKRLLKRILQRLDERLRRRNRRPMQAPAAFRRRWVHVVGVTHWKSNSFLSGILGVCSSVEWREMVTQRGLYIYVYIYIYITKNKGDFIFIFI